MILALPNGEAKYGWTDGKSKLHTWREIGGQNIRNSPLGTDAKQGRDGQETWALKVTYYKTTKCAQRVRNPGEHSEL